jgi:phosphate transport system substrate-binding protein
MNNAVVKRSFNRFLLALAVAGLAGIGAARSDTLILQGSTTFSSAVAQPFASAVEAQTGHRLEIIPNRSNLGLQALFEHKADLAMISTTLEREVEILRKSDPGLPFQQLKAFEITEPMPRWLFIRTIRFETHGFRTLQKS